MKYLKICDVKNIYDLRLVAKMGIPFVGLHYISENDRKRTEDIKKWINELSNYYKDTKSIILTKEESYDELIKIIDEFEPNGIQLHYPNAQDNINRLKSRYGENLLVLEVLTTAQVETYSSSKSDFLLIDSSFLGGTGVENDKDKLEVLIKKIKGKSVILAGGINASNIDEYSHLNIDGFDVQSGVKSELNKGEIDKDKLFTLGDKLQYKYQENSGNVGVVVLDIIGKIFNDYQKINASGIDFVHLDIDTGFIGNNTDLKIVDDLVDGLGKISKNINIQLHIFAANQKGYKNVLTHIEKYDSASISKFIHVNRDNCKELKELIDDKDLYFALDVRDILSESFEWEDYITDQIVLVLSSDEQKRYIDLNSAIKMIRYYGYDKCKITLDRKVDYSVITKLESKHGINLVSGSYLTQDLLSRYKLLKESLNE